MKCDNNSIYVLQNRFYSLRKYPLLYTIAPFDSIFDISKIL